MCKAVNVIYNFYMQHHTIDKFDVEVREQKKVKKSEQTTIRTGTVDTIYDIRTVKIRYASTSYKIQKMADVCLPPYIDVDKYMKIIDHLQDYFDKKSFSIMSHDDYIYLYYKGELVNNMINNMIVYYLTNNYIL